MLVFRLVARCKIMSILETLVYDRTQSNVDKIKELSQMRYQDMTTEQRQEWIYNLKGTYRYTDLNRVEEAVEYVGERVNSTNFYSVVLEPRKFWTKDDIPRAEDMARYLRNIQAIRNVNRGLEITPDAPTEIKLGWKEANDIEQILHDIELMLINITETYIYMGEIICGEI